MSYYTEGSLAVRREEQPLPRYTEKTEVVRRQAVIPAREKLLYLFVIVLCVIVAVTVVWKYAQFYDVHTRVQQLEQKIGAVEKENVSLRVEVNRLKEPKRMIEIGRAMGLEPVADSEIQQVGSMARERVQRLAYRN